MLQIDHVYEFLYSTLFKDFTLFTPPGGVPVIKKSLTKEDLYIFNYNNTSKKIFLWDQEPVLTDLCNQYLDVFKQEHPYKLATFLVTSELSSDVDLVAEQHSLKTLYYFYHGYAALDWYRGYYALNYNKSIIKSYKQNFISFNRIINQDRSYRIYWVSKLVELGLLDHGLVSFNVTDNLFDDWRDEVVDTDTKLSEHARQHAEKHLTSVNKLIIDRAELPGSASADIPRSRYQLDIDPLWHVVTETVFYYNKLHLTEKIFKPIVSKQPFMLLAAPGNLSYLRSYGFKTFDGIIDESYDSIQDNDQRIDAVAEQLRWYCNLSQKEKSQVIERLAPIVDYNFHHFYGEFRHVITKELISNTQTLFKKIGYDDSTIAYENIYKVLTN